jgi:hypothetical protein
MSRAMTFPLIGDRQPEIGVPMVKEGVKKNEKRAIVHALNH